MNFEVGATIKMFWVSWDAEWYLEVICVATVSKNLLDPEIFYENNFRPRI
jgi:hypothetical protein